jgi:hypothetical protein
VSHACVAGFCHKTRAIACGEFSVFAANRTWAIWILPLGLPLSAMAETGWAVVPNDPRLLAAGSGAVLAVSMLLAITVPLLPRRPPWLTMTLSEAAAAVAPSYLQGIVMVGQHTHTVSPSGLPKQEMKLERTNMDAA